jgi:hypothetical protein
MATTYTLEVQIGTNQMEFLVSGGYNLCIAKHVVTAGSPTAKVNVIWRGGDFQVDNEFQWEEIYQVYGSDPFHQGAHVLAETNAQDIQFGQTCVLGADRVLKPATGTVDLKSPFYFQNSSDEGFSVGVNCVLNSSYSPIFVTPAVLPVGGTESLRPIETATAWFQQGVNTATMIEKITSSSIDVLYDGVTTHTISYTGPKPGDAIWAIVN